MNRRQALSAISLSSLAAAQAVKSTVRADFFGVWKLVSFESKDSTGAVRYPWGASPAGRLIYDQSGRMSAQMMNPKRRTLGGNPARGSAAAVREMPADDMREILAGYIAYFGTFEIEESKRIVVHRIESCLIPAWVGSELRRTYDFAGPDRLALSASTDLGANRLTWQRERT